MALLALATASYTLVVNFIIEQAQSIETEAGALGNARKYAALILPVLIGITLISGLANYAQRIIANAIALNTVGDMQKQMFKSAHGADFSAFTREPIGNLISKFTSDITVISNALIRTLSNLIKDTLTIVFTLGFMLFQSWHLTLMVALVYPLAAWPIIAISKRLRGDAKNVQSHIGQITSELKESFSGARMVKAYGLEAHETQRLGKSFDERVRLYLKLVTEQARVDPILEVFGGLAIAGVVIFGVFLVSSDLAGAGDIGGVLTGVLLLSPRIRALGTLNNVVQEGLASTSRIFEIMDEDAKITNSENAISIEAPKGEIEFKDVHFHYEDGTPALTGLSLKAAAGETIALVGPSGGGKSTVMNLMPRLYDTVKGSVNIDGRDIRDIDISSLRSHMALVSQGVTLFNDTVAANIKFGDQTASREEIVDAAKAADAHDFIMTLEYGYDTVLAEDGGSLSGGQRQRLAIARAILRDAPILLLDEATSALDTESETKVQAALERLSFGRTTVVIAHRLSTVTKADCIYVLDKGCIVESGTHKTLARKKGGLYARLCQTQFDA